MKNFFYFLSLACMVMFAGCSSDNDEITGESEPVVNPSKVTVGIGLPGADGTRVEFNNEITNLVWTAGDKLTALGYDASGNVLEPATFCIDEAFVGKAEARFNGNAIENAVSYRFIYKGNDVNYSLPEEANGIGIARYNYFKQIQAATDKYGFDHIKDILFMHTDIVPASPTNMIEGGIMNIQNSVLKMDIRQIPSVFDADGTYTVTYYVNYEEGVKPSAVLTYNGKISAGNYLYMAFDPANDLDKGAKIAFELSDGTNTFITSQVSNGKQYEQGIIYTVTIDDKWEWTDMNETTSDGWVDLGLSVKWASCNLGAESPEQYGDYFAWGEIAPKSNFDSNNSLTYNKPMKDISGNPEFDAALSILGGNARMPKQSEIQELVKNCNWTWTTQNGVNGMLVESKVNGNNIFLPAAGYRFWTSLNEGGTGANYWSSMPGGNNTISYSLYFNKNGVKTSWYSRIMGQPIRPVCDK